MFCPKFFENKGVFLFLIPLILFTLYGLSFRSDVPKKTDLEIKWDCTQKGYDLYCSRLDGHNVQAKTFRVKP